MLTLCTLERIDASLLNGASEQHCFLRRGAGRQIFKHDQVLFVSVDDCQRLEHVGTWTPV